MLAAQGPNGEWNVAASAFISPVWQEANGSASYHFELGTREVLDATSSASGLQALEIGVRAASHLGFLDCNANTGILNVIPSHYLRFRAFEQLTPNGSRRMLFNEVAYDNFFVRDLVFPVEVTPGAVLTVDVWFEAVANAGAGNDGQGDICSGGTAYLDFFEPPIGDGIQVFFTPGPALTLTPRSGLTYLPVPEPSAAPGAIVAVAALLLRPRRPVRFA